jgi:hypothetical protein
MMTEGNKMKLNYFICNLCMARKMYKLLSLKLKWLEHEADDSLLSSVDI